MIYVIVENVVVKRRDKDVAEQVVVTVCGYHEGEEGKVKAQEIADKLNANHTPDPTLASVLEHDLGLNENYTVLELKPAKG
jgi:hypothetical protein